MLIFFLFLSFLLPGVGTSLSAAAKLIQHGKFQEARTELLRVIRQNPESADAFALLGIVEIQLHDKTSARQSLEHALKLNPKSANALYNLGVLSLDDNRPADAITYLERAARVGYSSPELAVNLVRARLEKGDNAALKAVEDARKKFPGSAAVDLALGNLLLAHGLVLQAAGLLKEADSLAPSRPEILLPLADACLQLSDAACANYALKKAKDASQNSAEYHFLAGKAALLAQREVIGFQELEAAIAKEPDNINLRIALARYYQKFGQQEKAIAEFKTAEKLAPALAEIPYGAAVSYFIEDDFRRAIDFSNRAIHLDPNFDRAIFLLGLSRFATDQLKEAEDLLDQAIKLQPKNAFYRCFQGMVQISAGQLSRAFESFREAIRLEPAYALPHFQLGRALMRIKSYSEARDELQRAVSLQPDLGEAYYQLGLAYRHLGDPQKASEAFSRFKQFRTSQQEERTEVLRQAQEAIQGKR